MIAGISAPQKPQLVPVFRALPMASPVAQPVRTAAAASCQAAVMQVILAINDMLTAMVQPFRIGDEMQPPIDVPAPLSAWTCDRCGAKRMSVGIGLAQLLRMIHRRALKIAALPDDERDPHYDLIRLSCCGAAEQIGQSPDKAAVTANSMVEFTRAMVGIIELGRGSDARRSANWPLGESSTVWRPGRSQ